MQDSPFYHSSILSTIYAFGEIFNQIKIEKPVKNGTKILPVALKWGPKQHYYNSLKRTNEEDHKKLNRILPQMSFFLKGMRYDFDASVNPLHRLSTEDITNNTKKSMYNPAPYIFDFELSIFTNNAVDMYRIIEQILPYFRPQVNVSIVSISDMNIKDNITVTLMSTQEVEDNWETATEDNRLIEYSLSFEVKTHMYPAIRDTSIICEVQIDFENLCTDPPELLESIVVDKLPGFTIVNHTDNQNVNNDESEEDEFDLDPENN